jgi:tryptophanyl-tRNA synthetase
MQPSGDVHLGNYLGMVRPALALQERFATFYIIADYHALTTVRDPDKLRSSSLQTAATFLSLGLDVEGAATLYRQSAVPEVCELAWMLSCVTSAGTLDRGHAVRAARDGKLEINAGTVFYPLLMSADILLYDSNIVPVGKDQKQHVEIARDLALKMNHRYGDGTLTVPEVQVQAEVGVVPGTDGRKMSKSYGNTIPLWASKKKLRKAVMRIVTDSKGLEDPKDPDTCNVFSLYKLFGSPGQIDDLAQRYRAGGLGYGHAKQELFDVVDAQLSEPREHYQDWMAQPERIEEVLAAGADRARATASVVLKRVRFAMGLT